MRNQHSCVPDVGDFSDSAERKDCGHPLELCMHAHRDTCDLSSSFFHHHTQHIHTEKKVETFMGVGVGWGRGWGGGWLASDCTVFVVSACAVGELLWTLLCELFTIVNSCTIQHLPFCILVELA